MMDAQDEIDEREQRAADMVIAVGNSLYIRILDLVDAIEVSEAMEDYVEDSVTPLAVAQELCDILTDAANLLRGVLFEQ